MLRAHVISGTGPATVVPGGLHAFIKTRPELSVPDIEFMFRGAPPHAHLWFPGFKPAYCRWVRHPPHAAASRKPRRGEAGHPPIRARIRASSSIC